MPFKVYEVVRKNEPYPVYDVTLPQCKSCRVRYDIYQCGCYDMTCTDFRHMDSCKTCHPRGLYEKGPEPTTKPKIETADIKPFGPCKEKKCISTVKLPDCRREAPCVTELNIYECAHTLLASRGSCRECFPPEDSEYVPTTRPYLLLKIKSETGGEYNLCDHFKNRKARQDERREMFQQKVKEQYVVREARQRQEDDTQQTIQENTNRWAQESHKNQPEYYCTPGDNAKRIIEEDNKQWFTQGSYGLQPRAQYYELPHLQYPSSTPTYKRPRVDVPLQTPYPAPEGQPHVYRSQYYGQGYVSQRSDLEYAPPPAMPSTLEARQPFILQADSRRRTEWQQSQEQRQREDQARFNAEEKRAAKEAAEFEKTLPPENTHSKSRSSRPSTSKSALKSSGKTTSRKDDGHTRESRKTNDRGYG